MRLFNVHPVVGHRPGRGGLGAHHTRSTATTDVWLTPRWVIDALGPFDLDPCASSPRPWDCAARNLTEVDDGLAAEWSGLVWLNPPYGQVEVWMQRIAEHGHGIALVFARTDTVWWHRWVFGCADAVLFVRGRLAFCDPGGVAAKHNAGGPSALVAYGPEATRRVRALATAGCVVEGWRPAAEGPQLR